MVTKDIIINYKNKEELLDFISTIEGSEEIYLWGEDKMLHEIEEYAERHEYIHLSERQKRLC